MKHLCIACVVAMGLAGCAKDAGPTAESAPSITPPAVSALVLPEPGAVLPFGQDRFVTKWAVLGPFQFGESDFGGDPQTAAIDKEFMPNESALNGTQQPPAGSGASWKVNHFTDGAADGMVNLDTFYGSPEHAAAYAVAWVNSPKDIDNARLLVGSDDYIKVWVNGKLVHTYNTERRAGEADQDVATGIQLKKGLNRIVVKVVDVVLDWNYFLRFATEDSRSIGVKAE